MADQPFCADVLDELEQIFKRLKIHNDARETVVGLSAQEDTVPQDSVDDVELTEVYARLDELMAALTLNMTSMEAVRGPRDLRFKFGKVVASSVFNVHILRFLMKAPANDHRLLALLKNLDAIYKVGQVLLNTRLLSLLHVQLLVCRDAARRVRDFGDTDVTKELVSDFEKLLQLKDAVVKKNTVADEDDFRKIQIYPNANDLVAPPSFLRANIVKGPYDSVDHYLDVQFRLLREDLIGPLRDAIQSSLGFDVGQQKAVVYYNVLVKNPTLTEEGVTFELHCKGFERASAGKEDDKLMDGSLLCLSNDDYNNVCYMAVIGKTSPAERSGGILRAIFAKVNAVLLQAGNKYDMVLCPAYFEAYRHVLTGLQSLNETSFPFRRYFVDVNTDVKPPCYLTDNTTYLLPLGLQSQRVKVLDDSSWPSPKELGLDEAQLRAFKSALTKELAIIQGPPGTGKTFLGLKIVETLLKNDHICYDDPTIDRWKLWTGDITFRSILVVCFTNHALDQFLEGILDFCPDGVIRVGGRSKCPALDEYNLSHIRNDKSNRDSLIKDLMDRRYELRQSRNHACWDEQRYQFLIRTSQQSVFDKNSLNNFMLKAHFEQFETFEDDTSHQYPIIHCWLKLLDYRKSQCWKEVQPYWNEYKDYTRFGVTLKEDVMQHELQSEDSMSTSETLAVENVWHLRLEDRWRLYRHWIQKLRANYSARVINAGGLNRVFAALLAENRCEIDVEFLRRARVIGMTTTCAAKNLRAISLVAPNIVIIEEAAEVLEAHALLTIGSQCGHVIMIGDQQQLRPNPSNYELIKNYNFDMSLFERLVNNGIPYDTLSLQHRMRPIISSMLTPHIYKELRNHESVEKYEDIRGVASNLFFVDHRQPESQLGDQSTSHSNDHEARFIAALCKYLVNQGYEPERITVLTTYVGQLRLLKKTMASCGLSTFPCAVIDNFQGEQNDIILLSLVRSNRHDSIGFLRSMNRICVLLSRARMGFFCIGNFKSLASRGYVWLQLVRYLTDVKCIGPSMTLVCPNHPATITEVTTSDDFSTAPEGGCQLPCGVTMICGHRCPLLCHGYDRDHDVVKCMEPCTKNCDRMHACLKRCWMDCEPCLVKTSIVYPDCGHTSMVECYHADLLDIPCDVQVTELHHDCGHENVLPCSKITSTFSCQMPCAKQLPCGHPCPMSCGLDCIPEDCKLACDLSLPCGHPCKGVCGEPCPPCQVPESIPSPCGHDVTVPCWKRESVIELLRACKVPCLEELQCGHSCAGNCEDCAQGRNHIECQVNVKKLLVCGHRFKSPCFVEANKMKCFAPCEYVCGHGYRCEYPCSWQCKQCSRECIWRCQHFVCTRKCYEVCDRPPCDADCLLPLPCGHPCVGLCGEPCPPLCKICGGQPEVFFGTEDDVHARFVLLQDCGHVFEVKSLDKWMGLINEANDDVDDFFSAKRCPKCDVLVFRASRYNGIIKKCFHDQRIVKKSVWSQRHRDGRGPVRRGAHRLQK